jgi:hypothetical protein
VRLAWIFVVVACHHGGAQPSAPTCTAAAEHVRTLLVPGRERSTRIRDVVAMRCDVDSWSPEVRECVVATTSLRHPRHCKAKLTAAQRVAFDRELAALEAAALRTPPACNDYRGLIEKLATCRAIPLAARTALEQGYREIVQTWARGATHDAGALEAQCRSMVDGLRQAIAPTCGW